LLGRRDFAVFRVVLILPIIILFSLLERVYVVFCAILINFELFLKHCLTTNLNIGKKQISKFGSSNKHIGLGETHIFWFYRVALLLFCLIFLV
jgi:hypothetical protein